MGSTTGIRAAISNNPTHKKTNGFKTRCRGYGAVTLCGQLFKISWARQASANDQSKNYNSEALKEPSDFKFELCPLHSPLLRASLLVSFPPLINMLKFRGGKETNRDALSNGE